MDNIFELKNNFIYVNEDLKIDSDETIIESNLSIIPPSFETFIEYSSNSGKVLTDKSTGGITILDYVNNKQPIMFDTKIIRDPIENVKLKFCCEEKRDCYLKKDTPVIKIIENVDHNFSVEEFDLSGINDFFYVEDFGAEKTIRIKVPIKLQPKRFYQIKSGIKVKDIKSKYLFVPRLFWKYGLVIQRSFEVITNCDNILFSVYNAEDKEVILGEHENYNIMYSVFKIKE